MEGLPEKVSAPKDIDKLYSSYEDLRLKARGGDSLLGERAALERMRSDIVALELEELGGNPELEKMLNELLGYCEDVRSEATILDAFRQFCRSLKEEGHVEFLNSALMNYRHEMKTLGDLQDKIEDSIRLLVEKRGSQRGLFVIASDALEPVQPLFIDQVDKDDIFKRLVQPLEIVSDNTLPPRPSGEIPRKSATLSAYHDMWRVVKNKILPSVYAHNEMQNRFEAGLCSMEDVAAAREHRMLTLRNAQAQLDTMRGLTFSEVLDIKKRVHAIMHPNETKVAEAASIDAVRQSHQKVRAAYTAVQHTLSVEQRIQMRKQIATLSSLVREAELAHAVSHATEHAPALAHATLASEE